MPTATPSPPPAAAPTLAPARDVRLDFTAEDWGGGYYRGDSQAYGRPWVAVYGALSDYPRATLGFSLDATPGRAATISITGLDDEWEALNPIALEVNGEPRLLRAEPVPELGRCGKRRERRLDDRTVHHPERRPARGTERDRLCQPHPGRQLQCAALCPAGGRRPGDLRSATASADPNAVPIVPSSAAATFTAADWTGAFYRGDDQFYGRPWSAIYGAASDYPQATIRFRLDAPPSGPATLTLTGLDDELADLNPIAIEVNDQQVFNGPSPFLSWDGVGNGENAAWTEVEVTIPAELLQRGRNEITVANLSPSGNFNAPPYVLLGDASLEAPGARVTPITADESRRQRDRAGIVATGDDNGGDDEGDD